MSPQPILVPENGGIPNNALPALIYRGALLRRTPAQVEHHLQERGWTRPWRNGIYPFHHYHSTAHEVLVMAAGQARVQLGGPAGPCLSVQAGDVLLLPAGTGHCQVSGSADLLVIGAYAAGRGWDLCRPEDTEMLAAKRRIAQVPVWERDPVS